MARILGLFPSALVAARQGASATQFYQALRDIGMAPRKAEAFALFKHAVGVVRQTPEEPFRNLKAVPSAGELVPWPTRTGTGVSQRILLTYRDRPTGTVISTYYTIASPNGVTREQAIATAISAYSDKAEEYNQDLIGAVHVAAYRQVPFQGA